MNYIGLIKTGVEFAASLGAGAVVGNAIKTTTPTTTKLGQKILFGIGGFVLSGVAGDLAAKYVGKEIDEAVEAYQTAKSVVKTVKERNTDA